MAVVQKDSYYRITLVLSLMMTKACVLYREKSNQKLSTIPTNDIFHFNEGGCRKTVVKPNNGQMIVFELLEITNSDSI